MGISTDLERNGETTKAGRMRNGVDWDRDIRCADAILIAVLSITVGLIVGTLLHFLT